MPVTAAVASSAGKGRNAHPRAAASRSRPASLKEILAYRNVRIIRGFLRDYDLPPAETRMLFREMLKLLWITERYGGRFPIWAQWVPLDHMWHWFVLHTEDYAEFCQRYFGRMLHHDPETRGTRLNRGLQSGDEAACAEYERQLNKAVETVWAELGARTANRWFREFWARYTPEFLDEHRRRAVDAERSYTA
jgi:hypothetical protein